MSDPDDAAVAQGTGTGDELNRLRAENEALRTSIERRLTWRKVLALVLVVLTSVSLVASSVAVWAHQVLFNTETFMETVGPMLDDPAFYEIVGDRASDAALEALDIEARLAVQLAAIDEYLSDALLDALDLSDRARDLLGRFDRPTLAALAPGIAAAMETRIDSGIHAFFNSEAFVSRFPGLVERVHGATVALVRGEMTELPNVYVENGEVRLNLIPYLAEALRQLGEEIRAILPDFDLPEVISNQLEQGRDQLAAALQARLPDDFGQVTVMAESDLTQVQDAAAGLDRYVWLTVALTVVLLILTIVVSPNRRRTAIHLGVGVVVAIALTALVVRRIETEIVSLVLDPGSSALAGDVVAGVLSGLRTLELLIAFAAGLVALVAYLAGDPPWFHRLTETTRAGLEPAPGGSKFDRWVTAHAGLLQVGGVLVAVAVLFVSGLSLASFLIIGLLLGGYLWMISAAGNRVAAAGELAPAEQSLISKE